MTPLHMACEREWCNSKGFKLRQALIENGADVKAKDSRGRTAMTMALKQGFEAAVKQLEAAVAPRGTSTMPSPQPSAPVRPTCYQEGRRPGFCAMRFTR